MFQIIKKINGKNAYLKSTKDGINFRWTSIPSLGVKFDDNHTPKELHDIRTKFNGDFVVLTDPNQV
jgi:hypothetical protein